ncbi:MAG: beta-ketoacyl synthase [Proteobacteria bacterium]|nr:beta-ketoacyl synthase [Pseudomonadota bacterium]
MNKKTPIAVIGMAGIFPGARDIHAFWNNIENKVSAICDVPKDRWILDPDRIVSKTVEQDKTLSKRAGLIRDFNFDPSGFSMDPDLLLCLDPMYHLVLTAGREALLPIRTIDAMKKRSGVILAAIALPTDSASMVTREVLGKTFEASIFGHGVIDSIGPLTRAQCLASRVTSLPAAILAKSLGMGGGSYTLDAACSSSLYAIKLACDELWARRSDMMLAGGVSRPESLFTQAGFTQLKALSPSGICSPFDANADGLVVGEGAGVIVLKRLDDAVRDQDTIHALIHGAGLSNDIGGNLLAPDSEGQIRAMNLAYENTGWSPYDVDHIECHGTGTPVGDAIELKSLRAVWGQSGWTKQQCAIGSVKSMVGHLLTGAGIAGTIKTLMAMKHKTLPPSLNFTEPAQGSPLVDGPFRVQTEASDWDRRKDHPRRAAMSAFGFGGINAHVLAEEWEPGYAKHAYVPSTLSLENAQPLCDVAVVGMGTFFGPAQTLEEFQSALFDARPMTGATAAATRWKGSEKAGEKHLGTKKLPKGNYLNTLEVAIGEFHIPPNEIPDILPQHLMMLKAAAQAMADAGLPHREDRPRMGTAIGMNFDFEATNFHMRWNLENQVRDWNRLHNLGLDTEGEQAWLDELKKDCQPPLSSARTTGALGGIIASRVAKEFRLGGPSFIVSCEDASGLKALEIGLRSIQNRETDLFLAGAVDLPGEIRNLIVTDHLRALSDNDLIYPFDPSSTGILPGEGAVAVVLKRLDKAIDDGDRIYSIIKGMGHASGGGIDEPGLSREAYAESLGRAFSDSGLSPLSVDYMETHGSGFALEDKGEADALNHFFNSESTKKNPLAGKISLGCTSPITGQTGAASGLTALIKASLCVYQGQIPPFVHQRHPSDSLFDPEIFYSPLITVPWDTPKGGYSKRACVASITPDGNICHVIIEQPGTDSKAESEVALFKPLKPVRDTHSSSKTGPAKIISLVVGGPVLKGTPPKGAPAKPIPTRMKPAPVAAHPVVPEIKRTPAPVKARVPETPRSMPAMATPRPMSGMETGSNQTVMGLVRQTMETFQKNSAETARSHNRYLDFSRTMTQNFAKTLIFQSELVEQAIQSGNDDLVSSLIIDDPFVCTLDSQDYPYDQVPEHNPDFKHVPSMKPLPEPVIESLIAIGEPPAMPWVEKQKPAGPEPAFPRDMCMEFAIGSLGKVLGPMFDVVDSYNVRVRLPDEPLMLVDRIMSVEGEKGSLKSGKVVTEHDVLPGAWYLDGDRCPVCISIEAGQADLFLCSYLGIDLAVKGKRKYRLLDAVAEFHSGLPRPGDIIRYDIKIDRFINQGDTYLFFFQFNGYIKDRHIISMRNGCAGFFTDKEVKDSGGIILTPEETAPIPGKMTPAWKELVPFFETNDTYSLSDDQVNALRTCDPYAAFGPLFKGKRISPSLAIPGGRMKLVDRVLSIDPKGGRYGLGSIRAQADIYPDSWFLTCHFVDDKVMPGTLMYECCMHTLRIFTMRMGWIMDKAHVVCEPIPNVKSMLKCRGPVTVETKHVYYVVEIKEIGYNPEPFVLADAHMYAQDQHIVMFRDMSMKLSGVTQGDIEAFWGKKVT